MHGVGKGEMFTGVLVGMSKGRRPLGIPRCRWENNIKMELRDRIRIKKIMSLCSSRLSTTHNL
jgi:hypothetical protein